MCILAVDTNGEPSEELISQVMDMGFADRNIVRQTLIRSGNDVNATVNLLLRQ